MTQAKKVPRRPETYAKSYAELDRHWSEPPKKVDSNTNMGNEVMLQRWLRETLREQPYHNIGAVRKLIESDKERSGSDKAQKSSASAKATAGSSSSTAAPAGGKE